MAPNSNFSNQTKKKKKNLHFYVWPLISENWQLTSPSFCNPFSLFPCLAALLAPSTPPCLSFKHCALQYACLRTSGAPCASGEDPFGSELLGSNQHLWSICCLWDSQGPDIPPASLLLPARLLCGLPQEGGLITLQVAWAGALPAAEMAHPLVYVFCCLFQSPWFWSHNWEDLVSTF